MRVANKIAMVTGGASGIGLAAATLLVREGATVYVADVNPDGADTAAEIGARFIQMDVSSEEAWKNAVERIDAEQGHLDILLNNAGFSPHDTVEDFELDQWRKIHAVVIEGIALGCKAVLPVMKKSAAAAIVNTSSVAGMIGSTNYLSYGAAKAAVTNVTKSTAMYCARKGYPIRCNSVHPGSVDTPILDDDKARYGADKALAVRAKAIPMGRVGQPHEVAYAMLFLASDEASFITGTQLVVDGGFTAR
jgi:3(or 17)beta-hydroxysteroid dehydrogenase